MISLPLKLIELEKNNFHLLLGSTLCDDEELFWIVDTGASKTVFDLNLSGYYKLVETDNNEEYQSAGISVGMVETRVGVIKKIKFDKLKIRNLKVALIDLSHVNEIYKKYLDIKIAGLLGSDVMKNYGCQIDYSNSTIAFMKKPST